MNKLDYFPDNYEDWLFSALHLNPGDEISDRIIEPLYALNRGLLGNDDNFIATYAHDADLMRSYTLYYMTQHMPKLWFMLSRCPILQEHTLPPSQSVSISDMGCGPGTFIWALLFYLLKRFPEQGKYACTPGKD